MEPVIRLYESSSNSAITINWVVLEVFFRNQLERYLLTLVEIPTFILGRWVFGCRVFSPPPSDSTSGRRVVTPAANAPPPARTATPGPNAFALRTAEVDAHRLRGNAFYQQALAAEDACRQDQEMASRLGLTAHWADSRSCLRWRHLGNTGQDRPLHRRRGAPRPREAPARPNSRLSRAHEPARWGWIRPHRGLGVEVATSSCLWAGLTSPRPYKPAHEPDYGCIIPPTAL